MKIAAFFKIEMSKISYAVRPPFALQNSTMDMEDLYARMSLMLSVRAWGQN